MKPVGSFQLSAQMTARQMDHRVGGRRLCQVDLGDIPSARRSPSPDGRIGGVQEGDAARQSPGRRSREASQYEAILQRLELFDCLHVVIRPANIQPVAAKRFHGHFAGGNHFAHQVIKSVLLSRGMSSMTGRLTM
jgi:hypothetical protein